MIFVRIGKLIFGCRRISRVRTSSSSVRAGFGDDPDTLSRRGGVIIIMGFSWGGANARSFFIISLVCHNGPLSGLYSISIAASELEK